MDMYDDPDIRRDLGGDHPWLPGACFIRYPELQSKLTQFFDHATPAERVLAKVLDLTFVEISRNRLVIEVDEKLISMELTGPEADAARRALEAMK